MTRYTGNNMEVTFNSVDIDKLTTVDINETADVYRQDAAGESTKSYLPGKEDGTATINFYDDTDEAGFIACDKGTEADFVFYPQGNSTGKPSRTVNAIVTNRQRGLNHEGVTPVTVSFQLSGDITDADVT